MNIYGYGPVDQCVCNQPISSEPYFGMQDAGSEIVFFDASHDLCLGEWGLTRFPDDLMGIRHCREPEIDPIVKRRLDELTNGYGGTVA